MQKIVSFLQTQEENYFLESVTKEEIAKFEEEYDIILPQKYKEWLLLSDGGELFSSIQFFGVNNKPIIEKCENYIIIGELASGDPILCESKKETIFIFNQEGNCIEEEEIYKDFYEFLLDIPQIIGIE